VEIKDYAIAEIFTFLLTWAFAPLASNFTQPWSLDWLLFQLLSFLAINFIIILAYNWFFSPPKKMPEVPNVIDAFNEGIINSKYNFCSTSTKEVALWISPTFLYYLNLNTIKSISEAAKGPSNVIFSTNEEDKSDFYREGLSLLEDYANNSCSNILSKYTGLRFLIYPKEVYEKNKEEIKSLISIHALGRIHCIPVIRDELLNRLNDLEKGRFQSFSKELNQKVTDEYTGLSRAKRYLLFITKKSPYKYTIPDFLTIDSHSTISSPTVWWYEKNKPKSRSDSNIVDAAQQCFEIISKAVFEEKEVLMWREFIPSIFKTVPVIRIDTERDFFSKEYYENWLASVVPKYPKLYLWIKEQEEEYLRRVMATEHGITRALDVGCGWGRHMSVLLENKVDFCAGIDVSPSMIKKANELYEQYGNDRVLIKLEDAQKLSFENEFFDLVICMTNTFGNLTEPVGRKAISEIYRVLKPKGTFILSVYRDSPIAKQTREESYVAVGLRPYPADDPSVIITQEGLYSKQFTYGEIKNFLRSFKNIEKTEVNELAFIIKAHK
jgi:ubiquinone/menaquinone biosynthesis C-methylase UbiE